MPLIVDSILYESMLSQRRPFYNLTDTSLGIDDGNPIYFGAANNGRNVILIRCNKVSWTVGFSSILDEEIYLRRFMSCLLVVFYINTTSELFCITNYNETAKLYQIVITFA